MGAEGAVTQEELVSLLASLASATVRGRAGAGSPRRGRKVHEARRHDFARSEGISRATAQVVEAAFARFARAAGATLSSFLHTPFQVTLLSVDQLSYEQFVRAVPEPTVIGLFRPHPLPGKAALEVNPAIGFSIVDRMLGGEGEITDEPRPLTEVEKAVVEPVLSRLLGDLVPAWQSVRPIEPQLLEVLDSASDAEVAMPTDAVLVASFEVTVEALTGMASICLPAASFKLGSAESETAAPAADGAPGPSRSLKPALAAALRPAKLTCALRLGPVAIAVESLARMEQGDIVWLDRPPGDELELWVGGRPVFRCRPVRCGARLGARILGSVRKEG